LSRKTHDMLRTDICRKDGRSNRKPTDRSSAEKEILTRFLLAARKQNNHRKNTEVPEYHQPIYNRHFFYFPFVVKRE
jgi:hypothetical protein